MHLSSVHLDLNDSGAKSYFSSCIVQICIAACPMEIDREIKAICATSKSAD